MNLDDLTRNLANARSHVEVVDLARRYVAGSPARTGRAMALLEAVTAAHDRIRRADQQSADRFHRSLVAENEPYYASPAPLPFNSGSSR